MSSWPFREVGCVQVRPLLLHPRPRSYLLYALVTNAWYCRWPTRLPLIHSVRHPKHIIFGDVLWATVAAVPLAFLITLAANRGWLHWLGQRVHVSNKFSDADVWGYLFNIPTEETKWVIVRDLGLDMAYEGWVQAFGSSADANELLIRDVRVLRDSTREELYNVGGLYIARERSKLTIELSGIPVTAQLAESEA